MLRKKKKFKIGSVMSGIGLGVLIGIWLNLIYSFQYSQFIYIAIGVVVFGSLGFTAQRTTEVLAYAISIYIFLQIAWDWAVLDRGEIRLSLLIMASILMITNIVTGYYNIGKPIKMLGRAVGMK